jgi:hypothetical protein
MKFKVGDVLRKVEGRLYVGLLCRVTAVMEKGIQIEALDGGPISLQDRNEFWKSSLFRPVSKLEKVLK